MPEDTHFLAVGFPRGQSGEHEGQRCFYNVDHPVVAEELLKLFKAEYGGLKLAPRFGIGHSASMTLTQVVRLRAQAQEAKRHMRIGGRKPLSEKLSDIDLWCEESGSKHASGFGELCRQAQEWEQEIRDEFGLGKGDPAAPPGPATAEQPAAGKAGDEAAQIAPLPDRVKAAHEQYRRVLPECPGKNGRQPTDKQCYDWVKAHNDGDTLPAFETWERYVREARKLLGEQKNAPRAGRGHGGSIVSAKDAEPPKNPEAD